MEKQPTPLLGMSLDELCQVAADTGMPKFAGKQMAQWLYAKGVETIDQMTNLSKQHRELLKENYCVGRRPHLERQCSVDGTVKYLFPVTVSRHGEQQQHFVETVYIPDDDRATLCVSSQVGCKMNCLFCQTGKQGWEGNLEAGDILNQIFSLPESATLTNIVFMGQGEPMDNLANVLRATEVITAPWGMAWSPRRVTVSSVGVRNHLQQFIEQSECHLAISLHTPFHVQRAEIMPAEKAMPIAEVVELLRNYDFAHQRRLSFEYTVFKGVNDTERHAKALIRLLKGLTCRINLIRYHHIPDIPLETTDEDTLVWLRDYLTQHGIHTTIRASRGQDIFAACGLLSTARKEKSET